MTPLHPDTTNRRTTQMPHQHSALDQPGSETGTESEADGLVVGIGLPDGEVRRDLRSFEWTSQQHQLTCATGRRFGGHWRGVPVSAVVETVPMPLETTHLVIEAADGVRACISIRDALAGLIAITDGDEQLDGAPRYVSGRIDGVHSIKHVTRLTPLALEAGESPEEYEVR